jgi:hypothetical protein
MTLLRDADRIGVPTRLIPKLLAGSRARCSAERSEIARRVHGRCSAEACVSKIAPRSCAVTKDCRALRTLASTAGRGGGVRYTAPASRLPKHGRRLGRSGSRLRPAVPRPLRTSGLTGSSDPRRRRSRTSNGSGATGSGVSSRVGAMIEQWARAAREPWTTAWVKSLRSRFAAPVRVVEAHAGKTRDQPRSPPG